MLWRSTKQVRVQIFIVPGILQETDWEIILQSEQKRIDRERYSPLCLLIVLHFLFFCCSILCLYLLCCRVSAQHFPWNSGDIIMFYVLCARLLFLVAGVCMLCLSSPAVYVFFTLNRSSSRRHSAHVSIVARARSIIYSFSFILIVFFFLFQCSSKCLGGWRLCTYKLCGYIA